MPAIITPHSAFLPTPVATNRVQPYLRAKVEHPFRIVKRQLRIMKVRFRGMAKKAAYPKHGTAGRDLFHRDVCIEAMI